MRRNDFLPIVAGLLLTLASCSSEEPAPKPTPEPDKPLIEPDKPSDEEDNEKYTPYQVDMTGFDIRNYLPQETGLKQDKPVEYAGLSYSPGGKFLSNSNFGARVFDFSEHSEFEEEYDAWVRTTTIAEEESDSVAMAPSPYTEGGWLLYRIFFDVLQERKPILFTRQKRVYRWQRELCSWDRSMYLHWAVLPQFVEDTYNMHSSDFIKKYRDRLLVEYKLGYSALRYIAHTLPPNVKSPLVYFTWDGYKGLTKEKKDIIDKHLKSYYVSSITGGFNDEYIDKPTLLTAEAREKWLAERKSNRKHLDIIETLGGDRITRAIFEDNIADRLDRAYKGKAMADIRQEPYIELARYEVAVKDEFIITNPIVDGPAYDLVPVLHTRDGSKVILSSRSDTLSHKEALAIESYKTKEGLTTGLKVLRETLEKVWAIEIKVNLDKIYRSGDVGLYRLRWSPFTEGSKLCKYRDERTRRLFIYEVDKPDNGFLVLYNHRNGVEQSYGIESWIRKLPDGVLPELRLRFMAIGL